MPIAGLTTRCPRHARTAFTLIEILIVVTLLGLAASLIVPHMGRSDSLQTQAAVRSIVADVSFAQFDAMANQTTRRVIFDLDANQVRLLGGDFTTGDEADQYILEDPLSNGREFILDLGDGKFGGTQIISADFDGETFITFDEVGGPVDASFAPSAGGSAVLEGPNARYQINVGAFTGRITVVNLLDGDDDDDGGGGGGT